MCLSLEDLPFALAVISFCPCHISSFGIIKLSPFGVRAAVSKYSTLHHADVVWLMWSEICTVTTIERISEAFQIYDPTLQHPNTAKLRKG